MIEGVFHIGLEQLELIRIIRSSAFEKQDEYPSIFGETAEHLDSQGIHVIVYDDSEGVATGRLVGNRIEGVCVKPEKRGLYYGDLVVKMLIDRAFRNNIGILHVEADEQAADFFRRIGFVKTEDSACSEKDMMITKDLLIKCKH